MRNLLLLVPNAFWLLDDFDFDWVFREKGDNIHFSASVAQFELLSNC